MKDNRHSVHAMMISVEICGLLGFDTCQSCGMCINAPLYRRIGGGIGSVLELTLG